jgi:hypothetical protein
MVDNLLYNHVQVVTTIDAGGRHFIVAEAEREGRKHRRVIGMEIGGGEFKGRAVVYSDSYAGFDDKFVYARHRVNPSQFFMELDQFYFSNLKKFPELEGRDFEILMTIGREMHSERVELPFSLRELPMDFRFFKIKFPFGELAIEFTDTVVAHGNQLAALHRRELPVLTEAPLVGFSAENSTILAALIAKLHWAAGIVPPQVLEEMIAELTSDAVPA